MRRKQDICNLQFGCGSKSFKVGVITALLYGTDKLVYKTAVVFLTISLKIYGLRVRNFRKVMITRRVASETSYRHKVFGACKGQRLNV